jgi:hypothetical protein
MRFRSVFLASALWASSARAYDCLPDPSYVPRREVVERFHPTLLVGWTFDRSPSGYVGFEASYTYQYRGTFGGYAQVLFLSDPDAPARRVQAAFGGIAAPWSSPVRGSCFQASIVDPRPLGRLGYAWRMGNPVADASSFVQASVSASAIIGVILSFALPVSGGHSMQPGLAFSLSYPIPIGRY